MKERIEWIKEKGTALLELAKSHKKETAGITAAVLLLLLGSGVGIAYAAGAFDTAEPVQAEVEEETYASPVITLFDEKIFTGVNTEISLQEKVIESIYAEAGIATVTLETEDASQKDSMAVTEVKDGKEKNGVPAETVRFSAEGTYKVNITVTDLAGGETVMPVTFEVGGELLSYVQGLKEWTIEQGSENLNYMDGITWDEEYIASVTVDASNVDLTKPGTYALLYQITATEKLDSATMEKTVNVTVLDAAAAQEQADSGKQVMTTEGIKKTSSGETPSGQASSQTSSAAITTPPQEKPSSSGSSTDKNTSSKPDKNTGSGTGTNTGTSTKPDKDINTGTTKPSHKHDYSIPIKETVYHKAETHTEQKWVVDQEAWTETINHEEEGHYESVKVKDAWTEEVPVYEDQIRNICKVCGADVTGNEAQHAKDHALNDGIPGGDYEAVVSVQTGTKTVQHDAVYEDQWVVDKAAWTETVNHPEQGHYETVTITDKAAWTEEKITGYKCSCGAVK